MIMKIIRPANKFGETRKKKRMIHMKRTGLNVHIFVSQFNPPLGPINGVTTLSVSGLNLGKSYLDITGGVTVAGVQCTVKPDHYEPSSG